MSIRVSRRSLLVATLIAASGVLPVHAQNKHWLLGSWEGGRKNLAANTRTGSERTLVVKSVSPDGSSAKAQWVVSTTTVNVTLAIAGDVVTFTTPGAQGNSYRLVRKGDVLDGSWTTQSSGHGGAIELKKK
jgi:hypothetical protein